MSELDPARHERGAAVYDPRLDRSSRGAVDLQALARDCAIQALGTTDAPLAQADELVAAVTGDALKAVVAMRVEQIVKHGHTIEADGMMPTGCIASEALRKLGAARDVIIRGDKQNLEVGVRRLAATAAMCMAEIDRVLLAIERGEGR